VQLARAGTREGPEATILLAVFLAAMLADWWWLQHGRRIG